MLYRLWRLSVKLHMRHTRPWTWNLRCATGDLASWSRGDLVWQQLLLNLPTWFGIYAEDYE